MASGGSRKGFEGSRWKPAGNDGRHRGSTTSIRRKVAPGIFERARSRIKGSGSASANQSGSYVARIRLWPDNLQRGWWRSGRTPGDRTAPRQGKQAGGPVTRTRCSTRRSSCSLETPARTGNTSQGPAAAIGTATGYFIEPTLVRDITEGSRWFDGGAVRGPVLAGESKYSESDGTWSAGPNDHQLRGSGASCGSYGPHRAGRMRSQAAVAGQARCGSKSHFDIGAAYPRRRRQAVRASAPVTFHAEEGLERVQPAPRIKTWGLERPPFS